MWTFWIVIFLQPPAHAQETYLPADSDSIMNQTDSLSIQADSLTEKAPKPPYEHQIKIGFDISRIAFNLMYPSRQSYEFQGDYLLRNDLYVNVETGYGKGEIDYYFLKYQTNSFFLKAGVQKLLVSRISKNDFDVVFIGANYAIGTGKRTEATYQVASAFGGIASGTVAPQNFTVHWGELVAGIRVEFLPRVFAGWNIRGKFLLNSGVFRELSPSFIAGYGKGDQTTSFDFNFYLCYALRWGGGE